MESLLLLVGFVFVVPCCLCVAQRLPPDVKMMSLARVCEQLETYILCCSVVFVTDAHELSLF